MAARDAEVCQHHAVAEQMPVVKDRNKMMCFAAEAHNLVEMLDIPVTLIYEREQIVDGYDSGILREGVQHVLKRASEVCSEHYGKFTLACLASRSASSAGNA